MSTLSDLLPAGSGGKNVDFVASGAINNAQTVGLKSDGTVEAVSSTAISASMGSKAQFDPGAIISGQYGSCFDSINNKLVVVWTNNNSSSATYQQMFSAVGTISGSTISFGATALVENGNTHTPACVFNVSSGKVIAVHYRLLGGSSEINANEGTVNPANNTITWTGGGSTGIRSDFNALAFIYDPVAEAVVLFTTDLDTSSHLVACIGSDTGGGNVWGSLTTVEANGSAGKGFGNVAACFDSKNNLVILGFKEASGYAACKVITVDGTNRTITLGNTSTALSSAMNGMSLVYDPVQERVVLICTNTGNSSRLAYVNGTVVTSGTPVTNWASSGLASGFTSTVFAPEGTAVYEPNTGKIAIIYRVGFSMYYTYGEVNSGNPDTSAFVSPTAFQTADYAQWISMTVDTSQNRIGCFYYDYATSPRQGTSTVLTVPFTQTNISSFIGIADAAIANTATGSVTIKGGIATNASLPTLTPNSVYYVQGDGTISTTSTSPAVRIGKALSSTSINLEFAP